MPPEPGAAPLQAPGLPGVNLPGVARLLAAAPICWGVSDQPGWGFQLSPERVRAEAAALGVRLAPPDLGAFTHRNQLAAAERAVLDAKRAGAGVIVTSPPEGSLDLRGWASYLDALGALGALCRRHKLELAVQPRFGSAVDSEERLQHLLVGSDAGVCLDLGESWLCGIDPLDLVDVAARRILCVHLKDVDEVAGRAVRERRLGRWEATFKNLFPPLGEGIAGVAEVVCALDRHGYAGPLVVEQDRVLAAEPPAGEGPLLDLRRSLDFLGGLSD